MEILSIVTALPEQRPWCSGGATPWIYVSPSGRYKGVVIWLLIFLDLIETWVEKNPFILLLDGSLESKRKLFIFFLER